MSNPIPYAQLVREDLPESQPVAVYHREKRYMHVLRMSKHPYLEITPAAMDTLDSLVCASAWFLFYSADESDGASVSFLLVERRRRDGKV